MNATAEREIALLQRQLDELDEADPDYETERKAIMSAIRDVERDAADEDRWREEGEERGWR